jgi:hypothetical protein
MRGATAAYLLTQGERAELLQMASHNPVQNRGRDRVEAGHTTGRRISTWPGHVTADRTLFSAPVQEMTHDMDLNSGDSTATGSDRNYGHSPLKSQLVGVTGTWDFPDDTAENHVTSLHPYPARFIPAIPRQAIQAALGAVSGTVWDPFAGSGTTLIEANQMGHVAVGVDVNHLAHFLQRVFTVRLTDDDVAFLMELEERVRSVHVFRPPDEIVADRKDIPHLTHWFSPGAIQAIDVYLHILQEQVHSTPSDLVARLSLSRVVVRVSRQQSDTQYRATKPDVTPERALATIASSLREVRTLLPRYLASQPGLGVF